MSHLGLNNRESSSSADGPNTKREYALDISFRCQSRIKLKSIVRMLSVSACWMSYPGLNREASLSVLYEY